MSTQYSTTITMSDATVKELKDEGWALYGFKAVQGPPSGRPVVWFTTKTFNAKTTITWNEIFQGYIDNAEAISQGSIDASNAMALDFGQTLLVAAEGTLSVQRTGAPNTQFWIKGQSNNAFTCGISQQNKNGTQPLCAFPLHGIATIEIMPIEKIVLMFATETIDTGQVLEKAVGPALVIDLTGAEGNTRTVSYDIDATWTGNTAGWAQQLEGTDLVAPLIVSA